MSNYFNIWKNAPEIELNNSVLQKYIDIKDLRKAAKNFYKIYLQGKNIERQEIGKIRISGKGLKEIMHTTADPDKLFAIPQIPEIIKRGYFGKFENVHKKRSDNIVGFYPIYANLKTPSGIKKIEVLIAKDEDGHLLYSMYLDYNRQEAKIKRDITSDQDRLPLT